VLAQIRELFDYTAWANERMLGAVEQLDPVGMRWELGGSFPSVQLTLAHILSAEWVWFQRWRGASPPMPDRWAGADLPAIRTAWAALAADRAEYIESLAEPDLHTSILYRNLRGEEFAAPLWQLLLHLVNHSTYHRGQITNMIRQLGGVPVNTDLIQFQRKRAAAGGD
jgi:uncharacterized damage-inducible protein DinB